MTSYPLIITRNRHNSLLEAIAASLVTLILSYGILTNLSNSKVQNIVEILFLIFFFGATVLLWVRFLQKNQILVKITERSIFFKKIEIPWDTILSYRITDFSSSDGDTIRHIYFKQKNKDEEIKFYLPEFDISVDFLLKTVAPFAQIHKFSFEGIIEK